jgi:hypothetical protein
MSDQLANNPEIFSSTGELGTSARPDGRLYHNATAFYDDPAAVESTFQELIGRSEAINAHIPAEEHISRVVFRGIVSNPTIQAMAANGLGAFLEVAMPVVEDDEEAGWLIYLAQNQPHRQPLHQVEHMVEATSTYEPRQEAPVLPDGFNCSPEWSYHSTVKEEYQTQLADLWESTFGWNDEEIGHLAQRLAHEKAKAEPERSMWFSAISAGDMLMSAAMAESLTLPGKDGPVDLVESTEWRTRRGFSNFGLMTRTLKALNAQIFHSLHTGSSEPPLVYAECSFTTRADRAGHGAGFYIPERRYAAQIALQNVTVDDGVHPPGLRDFIVMRAPTPERA